MVAAPVVVVDLTVLNLRQKELGHHGVVQTPTFVFFSTLITDVPKTVLYFTGVEFSKCVTESEGREVRKALTLLWCKAGHIFVSFWVIDINFLVRHIHVTHQNHGFTALLQVFDVAAKIKVPFVNSVILPLKCSPDQKKLFIFERYGATLLVVLWHPNIIFCRNRPNFGKKACSRIPLDRRFARVPVLIIFSWKFIFYLLGYQPLVVDFGLLNTEN